VDGSGTNRLKTSSRGSGAHGFSRQAAGAGSGPYARLRVVKARYRTGIGRADSLATGIGIQSWSPEKAR
jgi:hypothetical protein